MRDITHKSADKPSFQRSKQRKNMVVLRACLIALMLLVNVFAVLVANLLDGIDFFKADDMKYTVSFGDISPEDGIVTASDTFSEKELSEAGNELARLTVGDEGLVYKDGVTNVLLLGIDGHAKFEAGLRSDVMIILSIDDINRRMTMTSLMRDTYVAIPGYTDMEQYSISNAKLNAAHAFGGPALTVETIERNFGIRIDYFADVNYWGLYSIVDDLGGVTVDITKGEQTNMNEVILHRNVKVHCARGYSMLHDHGHDIHLNGVQTMAYCRIRTVGNGDYERTERQRRVLSQLIEKVRQSDYVTLMKCLDDAGNNLATNYTESELFKLAVRAKDYADYELVQQRLPLEGSYQSGIYHGSWILRTDIEQNRKYLYESIYGETPATIPTLSDIRKEDEETAEKERQAALASQQ